MKIQGFGKIENGGIHAVTDALTALCNGKDMAIDPELNIMQVTCKKCQRLKLYRDMLKSMTEPLTREEIKTEVISEKNKNSQKVEIEISSNPEMPPIIKDQILVDQDIFEKKEETTINDEFQFSSIIESLQGQFMAKICPDLKYNIYHKLSEIVFFSDIPKHQIASCLLMLNSINEKWSGRGSTSKEWIDKIKTAMATGYLIATEEKSGNGELKKLKAEIKKLKQEIEICKNTELDRAQLVDCQTEEINRLFGIEETQKTQIQTLEEKIIELNKIIVDLNIDNFQLKKQKNIPEKIEQNATIENNNENKPKIKIREDLKTLIISKKKPIIKLRTDLHNKILKRRK